MIVFEIKDAAVKKMLKNTMSGLIDNTKFFKDLRSYQLGQIDEAFKVSGKNITGTPWQSLKPATVKEKMRLGLATRILERTARLRNSFKSIDLSKMLLKITSVGVPYFAIHQTGGQNERGVNIPRRQILGHSRIMILKTMDLYTKFIHNKIKNG